MRTWAKFSPVSNYQVAPIIQELTEANFQFFTLEMVNWAIKIG